LVCCRRGGETMAERVFITPETAVSGAHQHMSKRLQKEQEFHDSVFGGGDARKQADEYYAVAAHTFDHFHRLVREHFHGGVVLDYGCGNWGAGHAAAEQGATLVAIDISPTALRQYLRALRTRRIGAAYGLQMNAEELAFNDHTFDMVCGMGVLHHLDLNKSFSEIARTLKPHGQALFMEPMGHNPIINLYRARTPGARTEDEHPLLYRDFEVARRYFGRVETSFFNLCTLAAIPLRRTSFLRTLLIVLRSADRVLFRTLPFMRRYAWMVVMTLSEPRKDGRAG